MKIKLFITLSLLILAAMPSSAQEPMEELSEALRQTFRFIYIAPDENMDKNGLLRSLEDHRNHVVSEGSPAIFYLVNNDNPIVVKFNMTGENPEDFEEQLLFNLRGSMSWGVDAASDRRNILSILGENDFVNTAGEMNYGKMEFDFHVGKTFWNSRYNETVIGALFFEINAVKYIADKRMQFNVFFRCLPQRGTFDRTVSAFGDTNFDNINEIIEPSVVN